MDDAELPRRDRRWNQLIPLVLILALGWLLRLNGLDTESIWLDEATSILLGKAELPTLVRMAAEDIHPPLYYILLHIWLRLGGDSAFAVRALSATVGLLSIAIIFCLGRALLSQTAGLISALLLAISPLHIWYSQETRMYALVTLLSLAASYWFWRALTEDRPRLWLAYALCMAAALYTHYHALFIWLFHGIFALLWWISSRLSEKGGRFTRRASLGRHTRWIWCWLAAQVGVATLFAPWVPVLLGQVARGGGSWVEKTVGSPGPRALAETWIDYSIGNAWQWYPSWLRRLGYILFALTLLLAAIAFCRRWLGADGFWRAIPYLYAGMYTALPLSVVWTVSQAKPMYVQRYLLPFLPGYLLLLAGGVSELRRAWRAILPLGLAATCLVGVGLDAYYPQKNDWRGLAQYVVQNAEAKDVAVFVPAWNYKPFDYYAKGRVALYSGLPVPIPQEAEIARLLKPILGEYERLWLIWAPQHYADRAGAVRGYLDKRYPSFLFADFGFASVYLYQLTAQQ